LKKLTLICVFPLFFYERRFVVNNFHPESLLKIAKQKTQEEVDNCLVWKLSNGFSARRLLFSLGAWMVARGEKLQSRYAAPLPTNQMVLTHHKTRRIGV